jgi:ferredoxin
MYPDLISVLDNEVSKFRSDILEKGKLVRPEQPEMLRGGAQSLTGYANAVESALSKGIPGFPRYSLLSRVFLNSFIGKAPDRVTLNALAILFAAFTVFEYALQSMLTPGTGRSINCYNCATCVGVCPIKEVEGVQMPMGLVLLTRLGDYDRVMELSKYCVGCGKCAAKCPIGNSGPLVISAAFQAARKHREEKRRPEIEETV